jgi:hypothetical protein
MSVKVNALLAKAANALPAGNAVRTEIETAMRDMRAANAERAQRAFGTMRANLKAQLLAEIAAEQAAGKGAKPATPNGKGQPARA